MPKKFSFLENERIRYVLVSLLLLAPCYWQPRIHAGDLSSHLYNSWLPGVIESGRLQGLFFAPHAAGVLFNLILRGLFPVFGAEIAQRLAVSIVVLTFVWGAFAFISAVGRNRPWYLMPSIAMLAYGWVFHMGFFDFYLGLGLSFWALALLWDGEPRKLFLAAPVVALAYLGHPLPVLWAALLVTYLWMMRRMTPRVRTYLIAGSLLVMVVANAVIHRTLLTQWSLQQMSMEPEANQAWSFGGKYYFVLVGVLAVWSLLFLELVRKQGGREVITSLPFQFCILSAAGVFLLPNALLLPGFHHALVYVAERMSLGVGICLCALLGAARPRVIERYGLVALAVVFFAFLYFDERVENAVQDQMQDVVAQQGIAPASGSLLCILPRS